MEKENLVRRTSVIFILLLVLGLVLTACSSDDAAEVPSDESVPAEPTPTAIVNVPDAPEDEAEEAQPVEPPKISGSKGQFDTEAVVASLADYVLRPEDMPNQYKIEADGEQHLTNLKVINEVGEVQGKRYIAATFRVDGWSLVLTRVNKEELIPYKMYSQVEVFETPEGAQTAFGPDWFPAYSTEEGDTPPNFIENGCDFGDACVMYLCEEFDPATELTTLQYEVAFVYKNMIGKVMGRGLDFDMKPDYIVDAAEILFEKIDSAPMAE